MQIFNGIETCPPCTSCRGIGDHLDAPGAVAPSSSVCRRCNGTGKEVPPLTIDQTGLAWVEEP